MTDPTIAELREAVAALTEKVATLEARVATLDSRHDIPEEHVVAIGAAVAAYFGHKAKVRAVRFGSQRWATATRGRLHDRSVRHR